MPPAGVAARRAALHLVSGCTDEKASNFDPRANAADPEACAYSLGLAANETVAAGPASARGADVVLELTATHLFLLFGLIAVVALLAAWVVNVMYCQPGEEDAGGGGAGEAPGAGGPGAAVAVHPPAPPLFEGRPSAALLVAADLRGAPALMKAGRTFVLSVQGGEGENREAAAAALNDRVGVARLDVLVVAAPGPPGGGSLALFADSPPTTAEALCEDVGEVDFWRELGALLKPAGSLYILCPALKPDDAATDRLARELGFVAERCVKVVHAIPGVHKDIPENLGHAAFLQSFDLQPLSQWWKGQRGEGGAGAGPQRELRPRTPARGPATAGAMERRPGATLATPDLKDVPWPAGPPPPGAVLSQGAEGARAGGGGGEEGGGRHLAGTPPLRSPKGVPPATTFNVARNLLKLKAKAKSRVKNW